MSSLRLGVNIDHVATLRQARYATMPASSGQTIASSDVIDLTSKMQADGTLDWTPPPGKWVVLRFGYSLLGITNHPATKEATGLEVDKLDRRYVRDYFDAIRLPKDRFRATMSAMILTLSIVRGLGYAAVGEFGREPKVNDKAGREHWPACYAALVAGGGVKGGRLVGTSDAKAAQPADTPLTTADLNATVQHAIGLTSEQITGIGLTPAGRVIEELM